MTMMTPEQRAKALYDRLFRLGQFRGSAVVTDPLEEIVRVIREAESEASDGKASAYDACVSVARKRLAHIPPELEAQIPRLCKIDQSTWEMTRDKGPIMAIDMLEHAKMKRLQERTTALESALEPFADVDGEGSEDFDDETKVTAKFGRTTHYSLRLGHFRTARRVVSDA